MQKIFIVEDDIDIQDILKNHLIDAGYEVAVASDGVTGIAMFDDIYYRFRGLNMVQGILAGLRPAVIAMIASAGISLLIMALYGQRTLPNDLTSLDLIAAIIFVIGFFILRKWKPNPLWVMAGSGFAGIILYSIV